MRKTGFSGVEREEPSLFGCGLVFSSLLLSSLSSFFIGCIRINQGCGDGNLLS